MMEMGRMLLLILCAVLIASAGCAKSPVTPPTEEPQPVSPAAPPPVGGRVWAVDPAGEQPAELLFESAAPLLLEEISPDGRGLVTMAEPGTSLLRQVALDEQTRDFPVPERAEPVGFLPDGRVLVARTIFGP